SDEGPDVSGVLDECKKLIARKQRGFLDLVDVRMGAQVVDNAARLVTGSPRVAAGEVLHDLGRDIQVHLAATQLVGTEGTADAVREERVDLIRRGRAGGQVDIEAGRRTQIA